MKSLKTGFLAALDSCFYSTRCQHSTVNLNVAGWTIIKSLLVHKHVFIRLSENDDMKCRFNNVISLYGYNNYCLPKCSFLFLLFILMSAAGVVIYIKGIEKESNHTQEWQSWVCFLHLYFGFCQWLFPSVGYKRHLTNREDQKYDTSPFCYLVLKYALKDTSNNWLA